MDIFEYNEVRWPTRALQQDEEEEAVADAEQKLLPPTLQWTEPGAQHTHPRVLVVAVSPASSALLVAGMGADTQAVGHVVMQPPHTTPASSDKADAPAALYAPAPGVLVCCCSSAVAPERAPTWARGIIQELQPQRLVLLGSMQVQQYRGEADASQELLAFVLRSSPLRQQLEGAAAAIGCGVPYLPSGSIVSGLPAALLTQAELAGLPAELLVVVEQVPSLVPETLTQLARLVVGSLQQAWGASNSQAGSPEQQWAAKLLNAAVVDAARLKLQRTSYRPSSVYS